MRKVDWDYTTLAEAYVSRPDYARAAIDRIVEITGLRAGARALDLGAGAGHLTIELAARGFDVVALEPNAAMRAQGVERTRRFAGVRWIDALMEDTGQPPGSFDICTYGSSFGVADRGATLREAARVLAPGGWFACVFNHRVLDDPLQREIETFIRSRLPDYDYGSRREEQSAFIESSALFGPVTRVEAAVTHEQPAAAWLRAWRSHATLLRQAGAGFEDIVNGIDAIVARRCGERIEVPYVTRGWVARVRSPQASAP